MTPEPMGVDERNRVRSIVNRTTDLRPLKTVATRAISLAEDERTAAMDLASVISSDQALTAKLLRLSNSAYYGYARRIGNVREAIILLGMRTVRSVAITSGIIDSLEVDEVPGFDKELFWAHSVCVGLVAEAIAKDTRAARPEDAFTAGVLHDVGKLAMVVAEPLDFAQVVDLVTHERMRWHDAELAVFGIGHDHVGARLAQRWRFPDALVEAIRRHHPERPSPSLETLADVVAAADLACNRRGLACGLDWGTAEDRWPGEALPPRAEAAIARVPGGIDTLETKARGFLQHVTARAPRWYSRPVQMAAEGTESEGDAA